jgi:hypothetical protein
MKNGSKVLNIFCSNNFKMCLGFGMGVLTCGFIHNGNIEEFDNCMKNLATEVIEWEVDCDKFRSNQE